MTENTELLLSTTKNDKSAGISLWDYTSQNLLKTYKQTGNFASNGLAQIGNDFVVAANGNTPLIHVWPVNNQEQLKQRFILPAVANVLTVSYNSCYLACGIGAKLYVWQISSGTLLCAHEKHLQPITNVKFSNDDNFLVTTGNDGQLVTYNFTSLISVTNPNIADIKPLYNRLDHSMSIQGLHVGNFGAKSRVATVSIDHTCRMYTLINGDPILTLIFTEPLTAVIFDIFCWNLFVGTNSGVINKFSLKNPPRSLEYHVDDESTNELKFLGHSKKVNCICLNNASSILISGSDDASVIIWDIQSRQCLRKMELDGCVNNVKLILNHENIFADRYKAEYVVKKFDRTMYNDHCVMSVRVNEDIDIDEEGEDDSKDIIKGLNTDLYKHKVINQQLYNYAKGLIEKLHADSFHKSSLSS